MNKKIGELWQKLTDKGNIYFEAEINGRKSIIVENPSKETEEEPDFLVFENSYKDSGEIAEEILEELEIIKADLDNERMREICIKHEGD